MDTLKQDLEYDIAERRAIEWENGATELQQLQSIQSERRRLINRLKDQMGIHEASKIVIEAERKVYG